MELEKKLEMAHEKQLELQKKIKAAVMRGVCALNMETLSLLGDGSSSTIAPTITGEAIESCERKKDFSPQKMDYTSRWHDDIVGVNDVDPNFTSHPDMSINSNGNRMFYSDEPKTTNLSIKREKEIFPNTLVGNRLRSQIKGNGYAVVRCPQAFSNKNTNIKSIKHF